MATEAIQALPQGSDMKQQIISMTQRMINIKKETDHLHQETHRILQEKANSGEKQLLMPETQHFVEDYFLTHKPELQAVRAFFLSPFPFLVIEL